MQHRCSRDAVENSTSFALNISHVSHPNSQWPAITCTDTAAKHSHYIYTLFQKKDQTFYFLNNSVRRQPISIKFGTQHFEKRATNGFDFVHLALRCNYTTLWNSQTFSSSLQHTYASRCSHSGWRNILWLGIYGKLLNISFTEATASHPKHRRWGLRLSAGQCTGSSCTSNGGAASSWETQIHCSWHVIAQQPGEKNRLITAFE